MKYAHIVAKLQGTPWLATGEVMQSIADLLNARLRGDGIAQKAMIGGETEAAQAKPRELYERVGEVAVIPVHGVIGKRLSAMETECGGVDVDAIRYAFDTANIDPGVSSILLDVDSPGGAVTGVPELAEHIKTSKAKPVLAYTDTMMASGGYYIAIAADAIAAAETAQVGSIGVISQVVNESRAIDQQGLSVRTFKSGLHKDIGSSLREPTDEEAAYFQSRVDAIGAKFRADIKAQRPLAQDSAMTGLVYSGAEAVGLGLSDYIANTRADAIRLLTT